MGRYFSSLNKYMKLRDVIYALCKPETGQPGDEYEKKSQKMAEQAKEYHKQLQAIGSVIPEVFREINTLTVLDALSMELTNNQKEVLKGCVTENKVETALRSGESYKSAGLDGISYKLWKSVHETYKKSLVQVEGEEKKEPTFNIVKMMNEVFNHFEEHGMIERARFSEGWMCPVYKKNDKQKIANYRPITTPNTDYKILKSPHKPACTCLENAATQESSELCTWPKNH